MIDKKYEITKDFIKIGDRILYKIRSLVDIPEIMVKAGDFGGYIENEYNLSHEGNCWIKENSFIYDNGRLEEDALIMDGCIICGNAVIKGSMVLHGYMMICEGVFSDNTVIYSNGDHLTVMKGVINE